MYGIYIKHLKKWLPYELETKEDALICLEIYQKDNPLKNKKWNVGDTIIERLKK